MFIVFNLFWNTNPKPDSLDCWGWTLGKPQYDWLKSTLENSTATFKFAFIHNLVGGNGDGEGRGGIETAPYYEWGGNNINGTNGWAANRPGWYEPIKDLLRENRVTILFHGHDHFFAKQNLDCLVSQECPQPSLPNFNNPSQALTYGYLSGIIIPNSGHIRVNVSPTEITVDYVRAVRPTQVTPTLHNKDIAETYSMPAINCYDSLTSVNNITGNDNYNTVVAYPDPFNTSVIIQFEVDNAVRQIYVQIYDMNGDLIKQLTNNGTVNNGKYSVSWDGTNNEGNKVADGTYFCKVITDNACSSSHKIILMK